MYKLDLSFFKKMDRNAILIAVAVIAVIITGVLIFVNSNPNHNFSLPTLFGQSDKQIAKNAIDYINQSKLAQSTVTLVSVSEQSGLVKMKISVGGQQFDSYVTKDGKLLFPVTPIDMGAKKAAATASSSSGQAANKVSATTCDSLTKSASPMLEAFVVSSCPYGLQMQRAMADAVKNAPALASSVAVKYIGSIDNGVISSMHGPEEAAENLRQICIRQEQPAKYWAYVSCYMKKTTATASSGMPLGDSTGCQASTGVDTAKLASCVSDPSKGLAYAKKDFDEATKYGVQGSPTLILGGATVDETGFGGRSADGIKSIVCCASKTKPGLCSTTLDTASAAVSFSATYASGSGSTSANTNCNTAQ